VCDGVCVRVRGRVRVRVRVRGRGRGVVRFKTLCARRSLASIKPAMPSLAFRITMTLRYTHGRAQDPSLKSATASAASAAAVGSSERRSDIMS
jgi:hypothetical protein